MRDKPPIPQSQKNTARTIARRSWQNHTLAEHAKEDAVRRIDREVGEQWRDEAHQLAGALIDYWNKRGILEPPSVYAVGEPGCDVWDE